MFRRHFTCPITAVVRFICFVVFVFFDRVASIVSARTAGLTAPDWSVKLLSLHTEPPESPRVCLSLVISWLAGWRFQVILLGNLGRGWFCRLTSGGKC